LAMDKRWKFMKVWNAAVHDDVLKLCRERGGHFLNTHDFNEFDDPPEHREEAIKKRVRRLIP
jgi:hypothetical protein